jgi:hypothetical protein
VYYRCLPLLGIQRHIELPWQTLPKAYHGTGLPNFALLSLASKFQLIQCIWGFKDVASIALWMGYETFIMDIGMYGNPFSLNYELYSILATNETWFKNVWELLQKFKTIATFSADNHIHPVRVGDQSLMQECSRFYGRRDLQALNIYPQYKKSIHCHV